jgi:transcriptional regulator with XRE-family HTH domain
MHYRATGLQATLKTQGRKARWLAEKVGVHESLLSKAMKGQRTINAETAAKIADLLGVPFFVLWKSPDGDTIAPSVVSEEQAA